MPQPGTDGYMRDWPQQLRRSAARRTLGQALYQAYGTAYELSIPDWRSLTPLTQEDWCRRADEMLESVKPQPRGLPPIRFTTGLRPICGPVVGSIGPRDGAA